MTHCGGCALPLDDERQFCSYWCHLVENGPAYFTLETITPWLKANRERTK